MKIYEVYDSFCGERTLYGYCSTRDLAEERVVEITQRYGPFRLRQLEIREHVLDDFSAWLDE